MKKKKYFNNVTLRLKTLDKFEKNSIIKYVVKIKEKVYVS